MNPIRLLIVDDSGVARGILTEVLRPCQDIQIVGYCQDGSQVMDAAKRLNPDVITLDVEMPGLRGPQVLPLLRAQSNIPVIMVSSVTKQGAQVTLDCLEAGAFDFVLKPSAHKVRQPDQAIDFLYEYGRELSTKIRAAHESNKTLINIGAMTAHSSSLSPQPYDDAVALITIGASTGGPTAVAKILNALPINCPPVVVAIHMPTPFTKMFAERLNKQSKIGIAEAEDGMPLKHGNAYIARGDSHLSIVRVARGFKCRVVKASPKDTYKPSIDYLFSSVAQVTGANTIACVLTGMGRDGAQGAFEIHETGGRIITQSESTSVIYGMPKAAAALCNFSISLDLTDIATALVANKEVL